MFRQAQLKNAREPLQVPYPLDFLGIKSSNNPDDTSIFISTEPRFLSDDEVKLIQGYVKGLNYDQSLVLTGCVMIDSDDPLLKCTHEQLNKIESENYLLSTAKIPTKGGKPSIQQRVLLIRERGYFGTGVPRLHSA